MSQNKLLLCVDMDRTVIPNGIQPEHPDARRRFNAFCQHPQVTLAYVTGRHHALVKQAIKNYVLPRPDYAITDVGTKIYQVSGNQWQQMSAWETEIAHDWKGHRQPDIKKLIGPMPELLLQEQSKQSSHKLSYYLPLHANKDTVIKSIRATLESNKIDASLIWSIDELKSIGLLDVLPRHATKLHAIEFLQKQLGYSLNEVLFAGDSGNDLPVLSSPIPSVLVANASAEIKRTAQQLAQENDNADSLYIAQAQGVDMNGNYAAGVLEGVWYFMPSLRELLQTGDAES